MKPVRIKDKKQLQDAREKRCIICGQNSDPCHVKSRGAGGHDVADNLLSLCRRHHTEQHQVGWIGLIERYPVVELHLDEKGWRVESLFGQTRLRRKDKL